MNTSPLGGILAHEIYKIKKDQKSKSYSTLVLGEKMQKSLQNTHFGYIGARDTKFCSIGLKFGPQVHEEFY
jgi:hypothetical protein